MKINTTTIRYLIPFAIFLILILFFWRGLALDPHRLPSTLLNKPTPNFQLPTLDNPHIYLTQKKFIGHVSLLHIWASWCVTCQEEQPFLMDLARTQSIPIYSIDYKDNAATAKKWLAQHGNPYQLIGFDGDGRVSIDWGIYGTPETFVIDKYGIIRYKVIGALTPDVWRKEIAPLIKMKTPPYF